MPEAQRQARVKAKRALDNGVLCLWLAFVFALPTSSNGAEAVARFLRWLIW